MISVIALVLCCIFVAKLMQIDRAASPSVSKALWVPTIWFLYCASRPLNEWFQKGQYVEGSGGGIESGSMVDRYFLTLLLVIGLVILRRRQINWRQAMRNNYWLSALLIFMLVSILWSDSPFVSFKRWVRTAGTVVMALVVLSEAEPYDALLALLRRTVYLTMAFSFLLVKYFPRIGVIFGRWSGQPQYAGVTLNKNTLGEVCMISLFLYIWTVVARRDNKDGARSVPGQNACELLLMAMVIFMMKGSSGYGAKSATYSATCIAALIVGLGVFFTIRRFRARLGQLAGRLAAIAVVGGLVTLTLYMLGLSPMAVVAGLLGRKANLTDRSELIWPVLAPIAWQNPILGLGYGAFWIQPVPGLTLDVNEAHNGYLDVFIELGFVGLTLVAMVVWMYFRKARNELEENFHWGAFRMSYLVMFLLHNWTETTWLRSRELLWSIFVVLAVVYPQEWTGRVEEERFSSEEEAAELEEATLKVEVVAAPSELLAGGTKNAES